MTWLLLYSLCMYGGGARERSCARAEAETHVSKTEAVQLCIDSLLTHSVQSGADRLGSYDGLGPTAVTPARRPLTRRRVHVDVRTSRRLRQVYRCQAIPGSGSKPTSQSFPLGRPPTRESIQIPDRDDQLVEPRRRRTRRDPAGREPRPGRVGLARRSRTLLAHRKTEQRRVSPRAVAIPLPHRTGELIPVHSATQL